MLFGKYKNKAAEGDIIYLIKDDNSSKWYAENISKRSYSDFCDNLDTLRDSLRMKTTNWYTTHEHFKRLVNLHLSA